VRNPGKIRGQLPDPGPPPPGFARAARLPWWQDVVIVVLLVGLAATGVMALWGDRIRAWFGGTRPAAVEPETPPGGPAAAQPPGQRL